MVLIRVNTILATIIIQSLYAVYTIYRITFHVNKISGIAWTTNCSHYTKEWYRNRETYPICDGPLSRSTGRISVAETAPKSPFVCVNRSAIWYVSRNGARATGISCSVNGIWSRRHQTKSPPRNIYLNSILIWIVIERISLLKEFFHLKFTVKFKEVRFK